MEEVGAGGPSAQEVDVTAAVGGKDATLGSAAWVDGAVLQELVGIAGVNAALTHSNCGIVDEAICESVRHQRSEWRGGPGAACLLFNRHLHNTRGGTPEDTEACLRESSSLFGRRRRVRGWILNCRRFLHNSYDIRCLCRQADCWSAEDFRGT